MNEHHAWFGLAAIAALLIAVFALGGCASARHNTNYPGPIYPAVD